MMQKLRRTIRRGKKKILILAGPNGAGKTTFAESFLAHEAKDHRIWRKQMKPNRKIRSSDPDILNSWPALVRAGKLARQRAIAVGAPFIVVKNGRIVDLNRVNTPKRKTA